MPDGRVVRLERYLERVGFDGVVHPDLGTLRAPHRAHQLAVPFENLDVQLRRPIEFDLAAAYRKIVERRRGGWCFEMNGVFGWALEQIGFDVTRAAAGVMRERGGDAQLGNHLCLVVRLDEPYLADVGFGGSLIEPLPLRKVERLDAPYTVSLTEIDGEYWRFTERAAGEPFSFDFRAQPGGDALMAARCRQLQENPDSPFVQNLVVQRRTARTHLSLRGRVLRVIHADRVDQRLLGSADELVATLREQFDLDVPEAASLWPAILARHDAVFPSGAS